MIKVLVIEDEMPILRSICNAIESENSAFQVVATAFNGRQALDILQTTEVQVVFVDINMPIVSGIEVLKYLNTNHPEIQAVVLSGYQDFSFAQQALRYGAVDYLLKPLKRELLSELLTRIEVRLYEEQQAILEGVYDLQTPYANRMVQGYIAGVYVGSYHLLDHEMIISEEGLHAQHLLRDALDSIYGKTNYWMVNGHSECSRILMISEQVHNPWDSLKRLSTVMAQTNIPVTVIAIQECQKTTNPLAIYREVRQYARTVMGYQHSTFMVVSQHNLKAPELTMDLSALNQLHADSTAKEAWKLYETLFDHCQGNRGQIVRLSRLFFQTLCSKRNQSEGYTDLEESALLALEGQTSLKKAKDEIHQLLLESVYTATPETEQVIGLAEQILQYLQNHYKEDVNSEILQQEFGFVMPYLREVFRKEYQTSPLNYVQSLRMGQAKQLLKEGVSVKNTAEEVGYHDPLYFSKAFKKFYGISPTVYVSSLQR